MKAIQFLVLVITVLMGPPAKAGSFELPSTKHNNANPFVQIHALQGFSGTSQLGTGEFSTRVLLQIDNEFFNETSLNESVEFDFERTTLNLSMAYGLNEQWAVGLDIPYLINSGGILDGLIESWHDLFGFNQGGRDNAPRDEFFISYRSDDQSIEFDERDQGLGDISLYADRSVLTTSTYQLGLRTQLKLPTGDEQQLFGSGGYALSVHLNAAANLTEKLTAFAGVGLSYLTEGDILRSQQNNTVAAAIIGLGYQFRPTMMLSAQLDLNSKVYSNTNLDSISGQAGVLFVSGQYQFSNQASLQIGFTEDVINKDAAPDFGIRIAYKF